jgi:hypothetical protein
MQDAATPKTRASRIAVAQMTSTGDQQNNLQTCTRLAQVGNAAPRP